MRSQPGTVLLHEPATKRWLRFVQPLEVLQASSVEEVIPLLRRVDEVTTRTGWYAAGFVTYEASPAFDPALRVRPDPGFPLAWFGLFENPEVTGAPEPSHSGTACDWFNSLNVHDYREKLRRIREYIRAGDTYQVNYTTRLQGLSPENPLGFFGDMVAAQGPHYAAFVETEDFLICSASPELFFRLEGDQLTCKPMKGTAPRGLYPTQDKERGFRDLCSAKNRAENIMIVDMVRNDLGRIAVPGSVRTAALFAAERYPTLWQLTSTVIAQTREGLPGIFGALFPAASITGAPKVRTMEIISELEEQPRRIYTGAIGFVGPERRAQFNVAIRTLLADKRSGTAEYGVGGGIVWDSDPEQEFAECRTKTQILARRTPEFELLETILWQPSSGYALLNEHLSRLAASAEYFDFAFEGEELRSKLDQLARSMAQVPQRVRVMASREGRISVSAGPLLALPQPHNVELARAPVSSQNVCLYHKTTNRAIYEEAKAACPGSDDVLLWNERGELTESTRANLVVEMGSELLTPPVSCGLLAGVQRRVLLEQKRVREEVIHRSELPRCQKLFLVNSVRGMWEIEFKKVKQ